MAICRRTTCFTGRAESSRSIFRRRLIRASIQVRDRCSAAIWKMSAAIFRATDSAPTQIESPPAYGPTTRRAGYEKSVNELLGRLGSATRPPENVDQRAARGEIDSRRIDVLDGCLRRRGRLLFWSYDLFVGAHR